MMRLRALEWHNTAVPRQPIWRGVIMVEGKSTLSDAPKAQISTVASGIDSSEEKAISLQGTNE